MHPPVSADEAELASGRYRLLSVLGQGGMATVYRARDEMLAVDRAIKILSSNLTAREEIRKRFLVEARTMAKLAHPNVVMVHDIGTDGERFFIVMELVEGGSLYDEFEAKGTLTLLDSLAVTIDVLDALGVAHKAGVVHRDIKPHNILRAKDGRAKVNDFGIAQVTTAHGANATRTGMVMGTYLYMAPELRYGANNASPSTDLYAVGATLFLLATGREPLDIYDGVSQQGLFDGVDPALVEVVKRACARRPEDRYNAAAEMLADVRAAHSKAAATPSRRAVDPGWQRSGKPAEPADNLTILPAPLPIAVSPNDTVGPDAAAPSPTLSPEAPRAGALLRPSVLVAAIVAAALVVAWMAWPAGTPIAPAEQPAEHVQTFAIAPPVVGGAAAGEAAV